jgi:hypothetical protein
MEMLTLSLWSYISPTNITLQPLKGNSIRHFGEQDLTQSFLDSLQGNYPPYQGLSLRQIEYVNKKILPVPEVQTIEKSAISYVFRYNFVKQLSLSGVSDAAIAVIMGWSTSALSSAYANRPLFADDHIPPFYIYRIINNTGEAIIDYSGDYLVQ